MFQYRSSILHSDRYIYFYNDGPMRLECELKIVEKNILRVYFTMYIVYDEHSGHGPEGYNTEEDIAKAMKEVDDFMNLILNHLVLDEDYEQITVYPYGQSILNNIIKSKYNLEYYYD